MDPLEVFNFYFVLLIFRGKKEGILEIVLVDLNIMS